MAIIGNRSVLLKSPGRFLNGGQAILRSNFNRHGEMRGAYGSYDPKAATPNGHLSPSAWVLAKTAGGMSSRNNSIIRLGASGAGSAGKNTSGTASITLGLVGTGELVSSTSGTAPVTLGATGNIFASKSTSGTATVTLGGMGTLKALGHTGGVAPITFAANWTPFAVGWIGGTTASGGVLSEASIIAAMNANPPAVNVKLMNDTMVIGDGTSGNKWRA
jgi:hypothetical protein